MGASQIVAPEQSPERKRYCHSGRSKIYGTQRSKFYGAEESPGRSPILPHGRFLHAKIPIRLRVIRDFLFGLTARFFGMTKNLTPHAIFGIHPFIINTLSQYFFFFTFAFNPDMQDITLVALFYWSFTDHIPSSINRCFQGSSISVRFGILNRQRRPN